MSNINTLLESVLDDIISQTQAAMSAKNINASGKSSESLRREIKVDDRAIRGTVYAGAGVVFTDKGRGPSKQRGGPGGGFSKDDAKQWARDKGLPVWLRESGKAMSRDEQAFLIMRKVHHKGFYGENSQGKEYLEPVIEKANDRLKSEIRTAVFDLVKTKLNYGNKSNKAA